MQILVLRLKFLRFLTYKISITLLSFLICLGESILSIRCKGMKINQINSTKYILIFSFLVFYNLNPLFGLFSSFEVWVTPSFSLSS